MTALKCAEKTCRQIELDLNRSFNHRKEDFNSSPVPLTDEDVGMIRETTELVLKAFVGLGNEYIQGFGSIVLALVFIFFTADKALLYDEELKDKILKAMNSSNKFLAEGTSKDLNDSMEEFLEDLPEEELKDSFFQSVKKPSSSSSSSSLQIYSSIFTPETILSTFLALMTAFNHGSLFEDSFSLLNQTCLTLFHRLKKEDPPTFSVLFPEDVNLASFRTFSSLWAISGSF